MRQKYRVLSAHRGKATLAVPWPDAQADQPERFFMRVGRRSPARRARAAARARRIGRRLLSRPRRPRHGAKPRRAQASFGGLGAGLPRGAAFFGDCKPVF